MDDTVQIRCPRCKSSFRDKARQVQNGYSRQCPRRESIVFFEDSTNDKGIQRALIEAKRLRRALREAQEAVRPASKPFVYRRS